MKSLMSLVLLIFFFSCFPADAALGPVIVAGITNTQAILSYTAPDMSACMLQVTDTSTRALANDLDPTKFAGSNSDSRPGNITNGRSRLFVIGTRVSERGLDGVTYSRALQAYTPYSYNITCPASGANATGTFVTANIALGNTYNDASPVDKTTPGASAWPTLTLTDRLQQIIDPFTGALLRVMSLPGDRVVTDPNRNQPMGFARSTTWSSPGAAISNTDGGLGSAITGNNTGTLLLTPANDGYIGYISFLKGTHGANVNTLNWLQAVLTMSTSQGTCNTSPTDDCKVIVCLTVDGVSCYRGSTAFESALTTTPLNYVFGSGSGADLWQLTGSLPPSPEQIATRLGTVTCDGSQTVVYTGGDYFGQHWAQGSTITVNGLALIIQSASSLTAATLASPSPSTSQISVPYASTNFGVLVRKKTNASNTISVDYAYTNYQTGAYPFFDYAGSYDLCGATTVVGPTGNPGYNCALYNGGPIYWMDSITGESHLTGRVIGGSHNNNCGVFLSIIFDSINPDIFYCGGVMPTSTTYIGTHLEPLNTEHPGHFEEAETLPDCSSLINPANPPCYVWKQLTRATTMPVLTTSFDPGFQSDRFLTFTLVAVENGLLVFQVFRGPYTSISWTVLFDPNVMQNGQPSNAGCVNDGLPGCVVGAIPSWSRPGARWCPLKSNDPINMPGWMAIGSYIWGADGDTRPGVGPYRSTVIDGTSFSTVVGSPGGPTDCPPSSGLGKQCTTVTLDGEPRDPSPCTTSTVACGGALETGAPGELLSSQVGDEFTIGPASSTEEIMRLVAKSGVNNATWTFQRAVNGTSVSSSTNPSVYAFCNANPDPTRQSIASGEWYWNYLVDPHGTNTSGSTILGDFFSINAHGFTQSGNLSSAYSTDPRCVSGYGYNCYQVRLFNTIPTLMRTPPTTVAQLNPFFGGQYGFADGNYVQSHPGGPGLASSAAQQQYFFDGRPFNGALASGSVTGNGSAPAQFVSGQLYRFSSSQMPYLARKIMPTFAFAGKSPLIDISSASTGNVLSDKATDAYKYCVANLPNECRSGSSSGDVFVNAPFVNRPYCFYPGQSTGAPDDVDLCITNSAMVYNSIMQVGNQWIDNYGTYQRVITKGLGLNRLLDPFWHVHSVANGSWLMFKTNSVQDAGDMILTAKVPPTPAVDSINRATFIPVTVALNPARGVTVSNAIIEFGYAENGDTQNFYCTSRAETCAVGTSTVNVATPFYFEASESKNLVGAPCRSGCSITIPGVSQHMIYFRAVYRDAQNKILMQTIPSVLALP